MPDKISFISSDLADSPPKKSYDVAVLCAVLQFMSSEHAGRVLKNIYQSIKKLKYPYLQIIKVNANMESPEFANSFVKVPAEMF